MEDRPRINFMWHLVLDYKWDLLKGLLTAVNVSIVALILSMVIEIGRAHV
jgi:ABC-type amino acid transport system permease subunit